LEKIFFLEEREVFITLKDIVIYTSFKSWVVEFVCLLPEGIVTKRLVIKITYPERALRAFFSVL
jgi:hypothetical protein